MNPSSIIARPAARPRHSRQVFCAGPNLPCRTFYPAAVATSALLKSAAARSRDDGGDAHRTPANSEALPKKYYQSSLSVRQL
jgi:hypothetical protein